MYETIPMPEKAARQHAPAVKTPATTQHRQGEAAPITPVAAVASEPAQPSLIRLQRIIGNRAVSRMIGGAQAGAVLPMMNRRDAGVQRLPFAALQRAPGEGETTAPASGAITVTHHNARMYTIDMGEGEAETGKKKKKKKSHSPKDTDQIFPFGAKVKVIGDSISHGKWRYVHAQQVDDKGSPNGLDGWVRAFNLSNFTGELVASQGLPEVLSPDPILAEEDIAATIRDLNDDGINFVMKAIANAAKQITPADYSSQNEEKGQKRRNLVESIGDIRALIQGLTAESTGGDADLLQQVQAYLYRSLAKMNPFYNQGANANVLYNGDTGTEASGRTCNVTVISMTLEGLGKSANDFNGSQDLMLAIARRFSGELGVKDGDNFDKLASLRLPDFLQLVAIYVQIKPSDRAAALAEADGKPEDFAARIKKARSGASGSITRSNNFDDFVNVFEGATLQQHILPQYNETLAIYGEKVKGGKGDSWLKSGAKSSGKKADKLTQEIATLEESLKSLTGKKADAAQKKLAAKQKELALSTEKKEAFGSGGSAAEREENLPAADYRDVVYPIMIGELNTGNQIVINLHNHFTRLEMVYDDRVVVDDPGGAERGNKVMTWAEARDFGYFKRYSVVSAG